MMDRLNVKAFLTEVLAEIPDLPEDLTARLLQIVAGRRADTVEAIEAILKDHFNA